MTLDDLMNETLAPVRVDYDAARQEWEAWYTAHPLPTNAALDARLADPATRAGFLPVCRERGYFHIATVEFAAALADTLRRLPGPWVEVGAGQGTLAQAVRAAGVPLVATDDGAWWPTPLPDDVERRPLDDALTTHRPGTVVAVWPPRQSDWPAQFRAAPGVRAYLLVGDGPRAAGGGLTGADAAWAGAAGWRRTWLPHLAARGRCRLDADGGRHTRVLLVRQREKR